MKKTKLIYIAVATALLVGSCKQEPIITKASEVTPPVTPSKGGADFTKFVAVGNSFVAGMQASSLYNESQANSLPKILAKQFESVGGSSTFNQPDINSVNGFNPINSVPSLGVILGRLILFDPDGPTGTRSAAPFPAKYPGAPAVTCPSAVPATPALPAPYNTSDFPSAFTGNKATLNNFGVPLIYLAQTLTPATGGPAPPAPNPAYSPFYARFATSPSPNGANGSTILADAKAAAGSFYLMWLGFDDVLLYAATGAANDGQPSPPAGTYTMTSTASFTGQFGAAMATMLTGTTFNGVVGNIPDFTSLPYFFTVPWNTITLDAATAATLTTNLATGYNGFLNAMATAGVITNAERDSRLLTYAAGKVGVLMVDEGLTDLTAFMSASPTTAALVPYARARQAKSTDLIPLAAGSLLGTCNGGNPNAVWGVSFPVTDQYALTPAETQAILTRTAEFNSVISTALASTTNNASTRLALADVRKAYADLVTSRILPFNGVSISPGFAPPTGAYSEDGLHPNSRGYAYTANAFIRAINSKFNATIPEVNLANYKGTGLPINP